MDTRTNSDSIPGQRTSGWGKANENPPRANQSPAFPRQSAESDPVDDGVYAEFDDLTLDDLRQLRQRLCEQESQVSYWRRILQARLDLLVDGTTSHGVTVDGLNRVLSEQLGRPQRSALLNIVPPEGSAPLPGLEGLWERVADPDTDKVALADDLRDAEQSLSNVRRMLHDRIDTVTAALVARYRTDPTLALSALPARNQGRPKF